MFVIVATDASFISPFIHSEFAETIDDIPEGLLLDIDFKNRVFTATLLQKPSSILAEKKERFLLLQKQLQ